MPHDDGFPLALVDGHEHGRQLVVEGRQTVPVALSRQLHGHAAVALGMQRRHDLVPLLDRQPQTAQQHDVHLPVRRGGWNALRAC